MKVIPIWLPWLSLICFLIKIGTAVKVVPLTNTTYLKPYTENTTFEHLSFDTPLQKGGKLVDYDTVNTYILAKKSFADFKEYKFMTVSHKNLITSTQTLNIEDYQLNGMCQYNGKLDYFIGIHTPTEELRVCNLEMTPYYCKTIPVKMKLEQNFIYSDCKYNGHVNGMNTYIIGIGGSSFDPTHPGQYNYLYAKFNTLYNLTETLIESHDPEVSERLVDIKVDIVHEQVYVVLDINSNKYKNVSIYGPGDEQTENNPNIAVLAYNFNNAVINWIKLLGDLHYVDYYADLEVRDNHVIVLTNSFTTNFTDKEPSMDILGYKLRYETGFIEASVVMGSSMEDKAIDLVPFHHGLFVLATIGNNFYPHPSDGAVWGTPDNDTVMGVIWLSQDLDLIDIEGYATSALDTLPMRIFPSLPYTYELQVTFIGPASKAQANGALFTQFAYPSMLFATTDCNLTCSTCNRYTKQENCIKCADDKILYNGGCLSSCELKTFQATDEITGDTLKHCRDCHYTCKECLGPKYDQCSTCCQAGDCGSSLLDMTPDTGKCKWPAGSYESHGKCLERCVNGLYGRLDTMWYESWPKYSHPVVNWADPTISNEYTHYEAENATDCVDYNNLLKFNVASKGIEVPGPPQLSEFMKEFTLSFWARAEVFSSESFLINMFDRVHVKIVSSKVRFLFERSSSDYIEPDYTGTLNQISTDKWIYISISQKEHKDAGIFHITQKLVVADGRNTEAKEAGAKTDHTTATYHKFVNSIFIGGLNYTSTKSFTGYIKEIKLFSKFHDSPQMINDRLRMHQIHSFEDPYMIAYWKLSENYNSSSIVQTIHDYSASNMDGSLGISFNPTTNPDYPSFVYDTSLSLKLCSYHDVATWRTVKDVPTIFSKAWRLSNPDNFKVSSHTYTLAVGDKIEFKVGDCKTGTTKAITTRVVNDWWQPDSSQPPEELEDGMHYTLCYYLASKEFMLELGQIYLAKTSTTVDPSDISTFIIVGLEIQIEVSGGDEAYGDIIRFSEDCEKPQTTDLFVERKSNFIYEKVVTKDFQTSRNFKMCVMPTYAYNTDSLFMDNINDHTWIAAETPTLSTTNLYTYYINDLPLDLSFESPFTEGDKILFAWKTDTDFDCDSTKYLSSEYEFKYGYNQLMWLGNDQGVNGIDNDKEQVHMCWKSNALGGDPSYSRIGLVTGHNYQFVVKGYADADRTSLPELASVYPHYGSTEMYGSEAQIQIKFGSDSVFPAKRSGVDGKLAVYRGAVKHDGSIKMITSSVLYEINTLDEANGLTQGNLDCSVTGVCNLTLSNATSTGMKLGEIYFLALFPNSFSNDVANEYFLFANNTNGGAPVYTHMFASRSFNVLSTPAKMVYGKTLQIEGEHILKISDVLAKEYYGDVVNASWITKSIKIKLRFENSTWNGALMPFASVYMRNVNETHITIKNMNLKGCDDGKLVADFTVSRAIKEGLNTYAYERTEYQKDVVLGTIGCDPSCLTCDGPTANDCVICANYISEYLSDGKWYAVCPAAKPYWMKEAIVFNSTEYFNQKCKKDCGTGYFVNDLTNECEPCNLDCQTCKSNQMSACETCSPIMYFYNGVCTQVCPQPQYVADNTNYRCVPQNITSYLTVEIIKDPYLHKIPKNKQLYLKAHINNKRGSITSAKWTQIAPEYTKVTDNVFTMDINNITNEIYNTQLSLKFRMTSFTYISELTSIKIMLEVTNSYGDVGTQLSEFYINPAPKIGILKQRPVCGLIKPTDGNCTMEFQTDSDWYDNIDDTTQQLKFKFYYEYEGKTFVLKNAGSDQIFNVTLPYISRENSSKRIAINACVEAVDKYLASNTKWITLKDILLTYRGDTTLEAFATSVSTANITDTDYLLYTAASMEVLVPQYIRSPTQPHLCTVDYQCYNGICDTSPGSNYCKCHQGFLGQNCQYTTNTYNTLKIASMNVFSQIYDEYVNKTEIEVFDFDIIISTIRGLLKDPELLPYSELERIMLLFEKCSYMENHKMIALEDYSLEGYLETAERVFGKIYLEKKLLKADPSYRRFSGQDLQQVLESEKQTKEALDKHAGNAYNATMKFLKEIMFRLDITNNEYVYIGDLAFEFKLSAGYPPDYEGHQFYIKNSDIYWEIPYGIFDDFQDVASSVQQIYVLGIKWLANPHLINGEQMAHLGTNLTTFMFFDNLGTELKVTDLKSPIAIYYPYVKATRYSSEFLKCQYFNETSKTFMKDGCGYGTLESMKLPCTSCAVDNSYLITDVFQCRCTHLTTIGGVYEPNSLAKRSDPRVGIYLNYFAMNYWKKSFGYYLLWPALFLYITTLTAAIIVDCFNLSKMRRKIEDRILLVGELNEQELEEKEREDEKQKLLNGGQEEEKKLENTLKKNGYSKKAKNQKRQLTLDDTNIEDKGYHSESETETNHNDSNLNILEAKNGKTTLPKKKKKLIKKKVLKKKQNNFVPEETKTNTVDDGNASVTGISLKLPKEEEKVVNNETGLVLDPPSKGPKKKKKLIRKKKKSGVETATNGEATAKAGETEQQTVKSAGDKDKKDDKSVSDEADAKSVKLDNKGLPNKMPSTVDIFEYGRGFWVMLSYSNSFSNLMFVNSYLCPRHIRASMLFTNLILIWFLTAVFYNNTKDPLVVPDFETKARNLAMSEIWIALAVPLVSMTISYIFWGVFRVSDQRFHQPDSYLRVKDGTLMKALMREMYLRFCMAYFIMFAIFGAVLWYIIEFTAKFGWKISWMWWYSGSFAFLFNYFFYDPLITWFHYIMYGCSVVMWRKVMKFRSVKIACPEIIDKLHIPPLTEDRLEKVLEAKAKVDKDKELRKLEKRLEQRNRKDQFKNGNAEDLEDKQIPEQSRELEDDGGINRIDLSDNGDSPRVQLSEVEYERRKE